MSRPIVTRTRAIRQDSRRELSGLVVPAGPNAAQQTSTRKTDHIEICLEKDVGFSKKNGFERYEFENHALPELDLAEIDTSTVFLGKKLKLPFFISALTGGTSIASKINKNLARAAEALGIGMGLGSQRAMLEDAALTYTYLVRDVGPNIFLLGNIGASQIANYSLPQLQAMVAAIEADGLAIHLNPCHEMGQPEGDTNWRNVLANIRRLCKQVDFPLIIKEVGCGISGHDARKLELAGVSGIDVAGAGGTCFAKVEYYRGSKTARAFFDWGLPTAESLRQCKEVVKIPLIASGGIRSGVECAKALALGASLVGFALPLLRPALESHGAVTEKLNDLALELRKAMLLVGARNLGELKKTKITPSRS